MSSARVPYWVSGLFFLVGVAGTAVGVWFSAIQEYRLIAYKPTDARLIDSHIETDPGNDGPTDRAVVQYTYTIAGTRHKSTDILPTGDSGFIDATARDFCRNHPMGSSLTAWYSPADPDKAFLIHRPSWLAPAAAMFFTPFFFIGFTAIQQRIRGSRPVPPPLPVGNGWFRLPPEQDTRYWLRLLTSLTAIWIVYCVLVIGGYFAFNGHVVDVFCAVAGGLSLLPAILLAKLTIRNWRLVRTYHDPEVSVNQQCFCGGAAFDVRMEQKFAGQASILQMSVGLVCISQDKLKSEHDTSFVTKEHWSQWQMIAENQQHEAGSKISANVELAAPKDTMPSTPRGESILPYFEWFVAVRSFARGKPKFELRFPIFLQTAADTDDTG